VKALTARRACNEIVSDYTSDSNPFSGYYSDSYYEFEFGSDPDEPESENSTTEKPLPGEDHVWFEDRWMVASLCDE
jgi:hypothetical protein